MARLTLHGVQELDSFSPYRRTGPVNWTPRYDAELLDMAGFRAFLRYLELNPVRAKLAERAAEWPWSSASAHCAGEDEDGLLCLDRWREIWRRPESVTGDWQAYLDGHIAAERQNFARLRSLRTGSVQNRPVGWSGLVVAASPPG